MKTPVICTLAALAFSLSPATAARAQTTTTTNTPTTTTTTPAYHLSRLRVFDSSGKPARLEDVVAAMSGVDAVLIGETHDDPGAHALEAELLRLAHERYAGGGEGSRRALVLSLEMFERDVQLVLDEYLAGHVSERHFLAASRPWKNYQADYRPLVEFARAHKIPVVAANAPARYVSRVTQLGPGALAALSPAAHALLPPLPVGAASQTYAAKFNAFMRAESDRASAAAPNPHAAPPNPHAAPPAHGGGMTYILDAQNLRDASMGHAISEQLGRRERALVLHVNGNFHSESNLGVPEHVRRYRRKARTLIVTTQPASDFDPQKMSGLGDFVVLTGVPAGR